MLADTNDDTNLFVFPELPDEAVIALDQFLEAFYHHFQNHYYGRSPRRLVLAPPVRGFR